MSKIDFLSDVISAQVFEPAARRGNDLQNLKSAESKRGVTKVLGCPGFYSCYMNNLQVNSEPLSELIKEITRFKWTDPHEELFEDFKTRISKNTTLVVPLTQYPFFIHVDSFNVGTGCTLVQRFSKGKRVVSFNSRVFDNA